MGSFPLFIATRRLWYVVGVTEWPKIECRVNAQNSSPVQNLSMSVNLIGCKDIHWLRCSLYRSESDPENHKGGGTLAVAVGRKS